MVGLKWRYREMNSDDDDDDDNVDFQFDNGGHILLLLLAGEEKLTDNIGVITGLQRIVE